MGRSTVLVTAILALAGAGETLGQTSPEPLEPPTCPMQSLSEIVLFRNQSWDNVEAMRAAIERAYAGCPRTESEDLFCWYISGSGTAWVISPKGSVTDGHDPRKDPLALKVAERCSIPEAGVFHDVDVLIQELNRQDESSANLKACKTATFRKAALAHEIRLGMPEKCLVASWGPPKEINRTVTQSGTREQWVYAPGVYIYLDNGTVTAWQDKKGSVQGGH